MSRDGSEKYININRSRQDNTYATEIWNAAIEAALAKAFDDSEIYEAIRKLKK